MIIKQAGEFIDFLSDTITSLSHSQNIFALYGEIDFAPHYTPNRISVTKERNLNREENFCGTEDVTDLGSKNREFHLSGIVREREVRVFDALLDVEEPVDMIMVSWSGQVRVLDGEFEGPVATDGQTGGWLYQYRLNLVSTGLDERGGNVPTTDDATYPNEFDGEDLAGAGL